jgi:hypothetical protein
MVVIMLLGLILNLSLVQIGSTLVIYLIILIAIANIVYLYLHLNKAK